MPASSGGRGDPWDLNRLAFHPDLLDLAERFLGSGDLRLYDAELWAKYSSERVRRGAPSQQRRQMMAAPGPEPPERRCCVRTPRAEGSATKGPPGPPSRACSAVGSLMRSSRPLHSRLRPRSAVRRSPLPGPARLLPRLRFPEPGGGGSDQPARSGHEIKVSGSRSLSVNPLLQLGDRADDRNGDVG